MSRSPANALQLRSWANFCCGRAEEPILPLAPRLCRRGRLLSAWGRAFGRLLAGSTASTMNQTSRPPGLKVVDRHRRLGDSAALIAAVVHNVVVSVVVTPPSALLYRGNWGRGRKRPAESLPLRQVTRIRPPTEKRPFSSSACRRRPGPPLASNQSRLSSRSKRQRDPGSAY